MSLRADAPAFTPSGPPPAEENEQHQGIDIPYEQQQEWDPSGAHAPYWNPQWGPPPPPYGYDMYGQPASLPPPLQQQPFYPTDRRYRGAGAAPKKKKPTVPALSMASRVAALPQRAAATHFTSP